MQPGAIRDSNFTYTAPPGMDNCADLHVKVEAIDNCRVMTSAWFPTPEELERLNKGEPVLLSVWGFQHPPVGLGVQACD